MDEIRKKIFPDPTYDDRERDSAYRALIEIARFASKNGTNVLVDATAHKRLWRDLARAAFGKEYIEVNVRCPVEVCIERETKREQKGSIRSKLYEDALERLKTGKKVLGLGKVPGVDEPFEESESEIVVDSSKLGDEEAANCVLRDINHYLLSRTLR